MSEDYELRVKGGFKWKMTNKLMVTEGYTVDNLDTKTIDQAESEFEIAFIKIRQTLEENESRCLDDEMDRLQVCHALARQITRNFSSKNRR